jgi:prepilin-type N-terminal cleavage/methylation domain-containing protein
MQLTGMTRLRRDEGGFTLVELLAAMMIAGFVLTALMYVFITGLQNTTKATDRLEGTQRARLVVDRLVTLLNSQVCVTSGGVKSAVAPGSNASSITFYADLGGVSDAPDRYTITYNQADRTLTEQRVQGSGVYPNVSFPGPTTQRVDQKIWPAVVGGEVQPVFRYYGFNDDGTISSTPLPIGQNGLSAQNAARVVKVTVALAAAGDHSPTAPDQTATAVIGEAITPTFGQDIDPDTQASTPTVCPS